MAMNMEEMAEEAALKAYPIKPGNFYDSDILYAIDLNEWPRRVFVHGFMVAVDSLQKEDEK